MGPMPDRPSIRPVHSASAVLPIGVTAPTPVRTTRRDSTTTWPLGVVLDVLDRVADRDDLLGVFVGDLDVEVLLERHDELNRVERVRAQVLDELCRRRHVVLFDAELLDDDLLHLLLD